MTWRSRNPQAGASWPRAARLLCGRHGVDASRVRVCVWSELQTHVMTPAAVSTSFSDSHADNPHLWQSFS